MSNGYEIVPFPKQLLAWYTDVKNSKELTDFINRNGGLKDS
jgi:hypothetical protein